MKAPTQNDAAAMLMALTQGVAAWVAMVPDVREVRHHSSEDDLFMDDFRHAELTSGAITLGVGALGTFFLKSSYPLVASILILGLLAATYEYALHSTPSTSNTTKGNES